MGSRSAPLAALSLLGVLAASCLGAGGREDAELQVKLNGSESACQGQLIVSVDGTWHTVDSHSWDQHRNRQERLDEASKLCRKLSCGRALVLGPLLAFPQPQQQLTCPGRVGAFFNCSNSSSAPMEPLSLICQEPRKTISPTSPTPRTTVAHTAPPRLRLVAAPGGLRCAGVLEVHMDGKGGSVRWTPDRDQALGNLVCQNLSCGSFLRFLPQEAAGPPGMLGELPPRWNTSSNNCTFPEKCFKTAQPLDDGARPFTLLCSGFQPKVQSRLVGGSGPCSGSVEVRQDGPWAALCGSAQPRERWEEVCREQHCGQLDSYRLLDQRTTRGQRCPQERLSQCHLLQEEPGRCKRVFVSCQDPNPAGLGAGSVASIVLALVLLAMLLTVCGPLAYKTLVKKFRQRKQRQWIGPTEMSQSMSFHRNHTATVRPSADSPAGPRVENEYGPAPRSSQTAYPALEGALHRVSAQPEYSSDSDYDLQGAQRL